MKRITVIAWRDENGKLPVIRDIQSTVHSPEDNARNVAKLIMESIPGNVNDIIFMAIEEEIKNVLRLPEGALLLNCRYDISSRIRAALSKLVEA